MDIPLWEWEKCNLYCLPTGILLQKTPLCQNENNNRLHCLSACLYPNKPEPSTQPTDEADKTETETLAPVRFVNERINDEIQFQNK